MTRPLSSDIDITAGETFTVVKVGRRTVAVSWGKAGDGAYYVTAGRGPAQEFATACEATAVLIRIATAAAGDGAPSVTLAPEGTTQ